MVSVADSLGGRSLGRGVSGRLRIFGRNIGSSVNRKPVILQQFVMFPHILL